jgi:hypothetical protein
MRAGRRQAGRDKEVRRLAGAQAGDELFDLAPAEFVAARDELARRLRGEGEAEAAATVKALRRPPLSAWAVNRLARGGGPGLGPLLAAGERLRAAHQAALAGEGADELRAAARAEREAVGGLVEAAMGLLREAGHPATDATRDRVAATLHAAAASPEAADLVRHGRLTADLDPSGFGSTADPAGSGRLADAGTARPARRATNARAAAAETDGDGTTETKDPAARRARRAAAVAARDDARKRARLAADQAVLATRQAERLGRLADQAEREAGRARATAAAAIEAASAARDRATRAAKELREAEDRIPANH